MLGEFVLPRERPTWTGSLVAALAELGVEEKTARQALMRTASEHVLTAERTGRRTRWHLTDKGAALLREGTDRIYGFGREVGGWDGRWLVLAVTVPEAQRQLRHSLRTRLSWAGFGSPMPGVWLTPDVGKEPAATAVLAELGITAYAFTGPLGQVGDRTQLVADAWHLTDVEASYRAFLTEFAAYRTGAPAEAFRSQVRLVQAWRRFPFADPGLPAELLPSSWPGPDAAALFHRRHDRWDAAAQAHWDALDQAADQRV
jgi:phenylacetic acid degradation operon negative regulatory protein